jgi:hypothetical protein
MSHNFIKQQEQREEWTKLRYLDETLVRLTALRGMTEDDWGQETDAWVLCGGGGGGGAELQRRQGVL